LLHASALRRHGFAPAPFPRPERQRGHDLTDVAGTWEFVGCESNGVHYQSTISDFRSEMTKERFTFVRKDGKGRTQYAMQLDPTASPPSFTWSMSKNVSWVGSYRLERDKMTMIFNSGNSVAQRPTDFNARAQWRYVLRRVGR
jgi:uncharacterized protein (TIGR03067 family)